MNDDSRGSVPLGKGSSGALVTRRHLMQAGGLGLGAVLLTACAGGSAGPSASTSTGKPRKGGTLNFAVSDSSSTENLDPALSISTDDGVYCGAIYESLTRVDSDFNVHPGLARAWASNADGSVWTFKLRPNVTWHDGSPFTAEDVVFSVRRWLDKALGSAMYALLSGFLEPGDVSASGTDTVVFKLKAPNSILPVDFAAHNGKITKAGTTKFTVQTAIGTGPFKLKSWTPGTQWSLVRNPDYWQSGLPYLDGINTLIVPEQGTKLQGVISGSSDVCDAIPISLWSGVEGRGNVSLMKLANRQNWTLAFDQRQAPFNDPRVLQALKLATDRETILKTALLGNGVVTADVPLWPSSQFYPAGLQPEFSPAKAKALLVQAGHPNGIAIELNTSGAIPGMLDMAVAWQQVVKPAGINVTLKQWPQTTYWSKAWMQTAAFQDFWTHAHPAQILSYFYQSAGPWDEAQHEDPALNAMISKIYATVEPGAQRQLIQEALKHAAESFSYVIPAFVPTGWAVASRVHGVALDQESYIDFTRVWLG